MKTGKITVHEIAKTGTSDGFVKEVTTEKGTLMTSDFFDTMIALMTGQKKTRSSHFYPSAKTLADMKPKPKSKPKPKLKRKKKVQKTLFND